VPLKKKWTKPEIRRLCVSEEYDPADGLTRREWEAARELQRRAAQSSSRQEPELEGAPTADADAPK